MNELRKTSAVFMTVTLLLSLAVFGQAKSSRKACIKSCKEVHAADLEACKVKKGKAKSACEKQTKEHLESCKKACSK